MMKGSGKERKNERTKGKGVSKKRKQVASKEGTMGCLLVMAAAGWTLPD